MNAKVLEVTQDTQGNFHIILDKTIFYPMGGGQATDQGLIKAQNWYGQIYQVLNKNGNILHYVKANGEPKKGDEVELELNWDRRYKNMKLHSAGHIVDFAVYLLGLTQNKLIPLKGDHDKNPHILYEGIAGYDFTSDLQNKVNELIQLDLPFATQFMSLEELQTRAIYLQPGLPKDKPLRALTLEGVGTVADGGTQVARTGEVAQIQVRVDVDGNQTKVSYNLTN